MWAMDSSLHPWTLPTPWCGPWTPRYTLGPCLHPDVGHGLLTTPLDPVYTPNVGHGLLATPLDPVYTLMWAMDSLLHPWTLSTPLMWAMDSLLHPWTLSTPLIMWTMDSSLHPWTLSTPLCGLATLLDPVYSPDVGHRPFDCPWEHVPWFLQQFFAPSETLLNSYESIQHLDHATSLCCVN